MFLESLISGGAEGVLKGLGGFAKDIRQAITGEISPEKRAEIEQKLVELEFCAQKAQTDINIAEAQNPNVFVAGWRPFVGWVCGSGLAYATVLQPLMSWWAKLYNPEFQAPEIETGVLMTMLGGLLGFGGMRTYEKLNDIHKAH